MISGDSIHSTAMTTSARLAKKTPLPAASLPPAQALCQQAAEKRAQGEYQDALDCYELAARMLGTGSLRRSPGSRMTGTGESLLARVRPADKVETVRLLIQVAGAFLESPPAVRERVDHSVFHRLRTFAGRCSQPALRAEGYLRYAAAQVYGFGHRVSYGDRYLETGAHLIDDLPPGPDRSRLYALAAHETLMLSADLDRAARYARLALDGSAPATGSTPWATLSWVHLLEGRVSEVEHAAEAAATSTSLRPADLATVVAHRAMAARLRGQMMEAGRLLEQARSHGDALAQSPEALLAAGTLLSAQGFVQAGKRDLEGAAAAYAAACDRFAQAHRSMLLLVWAENSSIDASLDLLEAQRPAPLDLAACRTLLQRHRTARHHSHYFEGITARLHGRMAALEGRRETAMSFFARAIELLDMSSAWESARAHVERGKWRKRWSLERGRDDLRMAIEVYHRLGTLTDELAAVRLLS